MARRTWQAHGALVALLLSGCFSDQEGSSAGASASQGTTSAETSSPTSVTSSTTGQDSVTEGTSEGGTSPTDPTATSTAGTTTAAPSCDLNPECEPGQVDSGAACGGGCGEEQRVCDDACGWGEWSCVADENTCGVWMLAEGADEWEARPLALNGGVDLMPDDPIQAAFDVASKEVAYVLTEKEYHVLDLSNLIWIARGDRQDIFDEATEQNLEGAVSINDGLLFGQAPSPAESIYLYSDEDFWAFKFDADEGAAVFVEEGPCCGDDEDWMGPHAPDPADVRGIWFDAEGNPDWHQVLLGGCDGIADESLMQAYMGFSVVADTIRLRDYGGQCDDFLATHPYDGYEPFTRPNAPPSPAMTGASLFHDGMLMVFTAND